MPWLMQMLTGNFVKLLVDPIKKATGSFELEVWFWRYIYGPQTVVDDLKTAINTVRNLKSRRVTRFLDLS